MPEEAATETKIAKQRSPTSPYVPLGIAIDRIKTIYSKIKDFPQNRDQVAKAYGKPPNSSATHQTLATLQQYGLLEPVIVNSERRLRVSALAKTIIHPNVPQDKYKESIKRAALGPAVFSELWDKYGDLNGLSDDLPIYYLSHDREQEYGSVFTEPTARDAVRVYRATLAFAGIEASDNSEGEEEAVDEWEAADPALQHRQPMQEVAMSEPRMEPMPPQPSVPQAMGMSAGSRADTCNIPEGIVTLSFPEEFSQASLEDIEAWLDFQKNRLKRWVKAN